MEHRGVDEEGCWWELHQIFLGMAVLVETQVRWMTGNHGGGKGSGRVCRRAWATEDLLQWQS